MAKRKRADKGRAVARFIATEAEVPAQFEGVGNWINLPYPYRCKLATDRSLARIWEYLSHVGEDGFVIRYDGNIPTVSEATVTMRMGIFAALLKAHSKANAREGE